MPLLDITNPDVIKFLIESYDKTTRLRMKWNSIYGENLKEAATLKRAEKGYRDTDVIEETMICGMNAITCGYAVSGRNRRLKAIRDGIHIPGIADLKKGHTIPEVGLGDPKDDPKLGRPDTDLSIDPIMRPVKPEHKKIIYKDLPRYGRSVYLKHRNRISPEDKYYFRECSGWECGWRQNDSYFRKNAPQHGRVWRLTRDGKSRTGPQPDPHYYKDSEIPGPTKCIM